jgi:hypothetical protein
MLILIRSGSSIDHGDIFGGISSLFTVCRGIVHCLFVFLGRRIFRAFTRNIHSLFLLVYLSNGWFQVSGRSHLGVRAQMIDRKQSQRAPTKEGVILGMVLGFNARVGIQCFDKFIKMRFERGYHLAHLLGYRRQFRLHDNQLIRFFFFVVVGVCSQQRTIYSALSRVAILVVVVRIHSINVIINIIRNNRSRFRHGFVDIWLASMFFPSTPLLFGRLQDVFQQFQMLRTVRLNLPHQSLGSLQEIGQFGTKYWNFRLQVMGRNQELRQDVDAKVGIRQLNV